MVPLSGCTSLATDVAKSAVGLNDPPGIEADANLDVGAAVQLGKTNNNVKTSKKQTDKRLVTNTTKTENRAETLNQSWSIPWWALLIAVFTGILVDPLSIYARYREIRQSRMGS